jgi:PKD repeat protein
MRHVAAEIAVVAIAVLLLAACERDTSTPATGGASVAAAPTAVAPTAVAPTIAATAAPAAAADADADSDGDTAGSNDDVQLFAEADPDNGQAPLRVRFSVDAILDGELDGATFTWNFGDGSPPSQERNPEHTYAKAGDYLATVRAVNKIGEHGWDEVDVEVTASELPAGEE